MRTLGLTLVIALMADLVGGAPPIRFQEVSEEWGVVFRHHHGGSGDYFMPETFGSGIVAFDYDSDGDDDVLLIDSGPLPGYEGEPTGSRLFRNDGPGRFVDATSRAELEIVSYGMGGTAGDIDADGDQDLYVGAFGSNRLIENLGDGRFIDVTERAGVGDEAFASSVAFADTDRDGDLDLYVTNYVDFTVDNNPVCGKLELDFRMYCPPEMFNGVGDILYRNRGDGTFVDATTEAGLDGADGPGLGVIFADIDLDGWLDLYVANDMRPNFLFRNRGDGSFEEIGLLSGVAVNSRGKPEASMGLDVGDLDGDGFPEIMATHFALETNAVYSYRGGWMFVDRRFPSGLAEPSSDKVSFGMMFVDLDHDGHLDVVVANGHTDQRLQMSSYEQENQVFRNPGGPGRFEVPDAGLDIVRSSRGLAGADFDLDGDMDLIIANSNDLAEVYERVERPALAWVQVETLDRVGSPNVGARLEILAAGNSQWREVRSASSYQSQHSSRAHFGLGSADAIDRLVVTSAAGQRREYRGLPARRRVRVRE